MDTIASIATAVGAGGIAVIRISGPEAKSVLSRVFAPHVPQKMSSRMLTYGYVMENGQKVDECMAVWMRAPHTYTTEDVAEIQCHGGQVTAQRVLDVVLRSGARLAEPGEFTKRAFFGGRIDLTQAEGVGEIYAYEVDGLGHQLLMDDANVPSLLALPYLDVCAKDDPLYLRTRAFVLSPANSCWGEGKYARGIGSKHTAPGYVWPIALCVQSITSRDNAEAAELLKMLLATDAGTGLMHESFDPDAPERFPRDWFAWANSMFGEMIYRLYDEGRLEDVMKRM